MSERTVTAARVKLIVIVVVILLFGIFLGKNSTRTAVWVFGWTPEVPLIVIALVCFLIGCICGWILSVLYRRRQEEE
jgi:uncharacterized integral membrane protein